MEIENVLKIYEFRVGNNKARGHSNNPLISGLPALVPPLALEELERQHIERTLRHHSGNRTRSAEELGISRATLINKIKRWKLDV